MVVSVHLHHQVPRVTGSRLVPKCKLDSLHVGWMLPASLLNSYGYTQVVGISYAAVKMWIYFPIPGLMLMTVSGNVSWFGCGFFPH
jgi:hypothetical protein